MVSFCSRWLCFYFVFVTFMAPGFCELFSTENSNEDEWIDPHDMFNHNNILNGNIGDISEETKEAAEVFQAVKSKSSANVRTSNDSPPDIYIRRWLKKLLLKMQESSWQINEVNFIEIPFHGKSKIHLQKTLQEIPVNLYLLDELISEAFSGATISHRKIHFVDIGMNLYYLHREKISIILIISVVVCAVYIVTKNPFTILFLVVVGIVIFWEWNYLYQKKVSEKILHEDSLNHPAECKKSGLAFYELFYYKIIGYFWGSVDCSKYYEAKYVDPFWEVNLTQAFSNALSSFLLQPLKVLGNTVNCFIKELFSGLSLSSQLAAFFFVCFLLLLLFKCKVTFPLYLGSIEPFHTSEKVQQISHANHSRNKSLFENICGIFRNALVLGNKRGKLSHKTEAGSKSPLRKGNQKMKNFKSEPPVLSHISRNRKVFTEGNSLIITFDNDHISQDSSFKTMYLRFKDSRPIPSYEQKTLDPPFSWCREHLRSSKKASFNPLFPQNIGFNPEILREAKSKQDHIEECDIEDLGPEPNLEFLVNSN